MPNGVTELKLGDRVKLNLTGAIGTVTGVADLKGSGRKYLVEYALASGEIKSGWFAPDEITLEVPYNP